ncbi:DNA-3-methyladenine glycosylase [Spiroplasma eriocheiris]|uniref:Putative 3-methyladenine DNA glycosylase n=1 Tax=Spiroplasma eriocheiris TaxID=315358 RepID=A0A0H3XKA6_9MOLU|nr:DNA-3-methyladenine glycosylase [Spiroplasma eriocheiris]AHF57352.1 DNA-3-methyladenine glycosylase [Spiroplasma eriocheiris CCTCC M 207170]AKM53809.1 3-methyladenine DNA glycosylase [Spiroplasma eriocheiris]
MTNLQQRITDPQFFAKNAIVVAQSLLNKYLVRIIDGKKIIARIVEVEAYDGPTDDANHAFNNKRTARNETLFWKGGFVHIFIIYGMYYCLNFVCDQENYPSAVLIRACEIISDEREEVFQPNFKLANGPGKVCRYLKIDKTNDGLDLLTNDELFLLDNEELPPSAIVTTPRINVDYATVAKDHLYRFYIKNNPAISKK